MHKSGHIGSKKDLNSEKSFKKGRKKQTADCKTLNHGSNP